jgi:arsenate reductase
MFVARRARVIELNADAVTIYHNPDCGTSRNTLALIRASGFEPEVIEYLKTPPDRALLQSLIARAGVNVRDVLRAKSAPSGLNLESPGLADDELIGHMLAHPILINRPLVVTPLGVKLCRPSDIVLDVLPRRPTREFLKEDGSPILVDTVIDAEDSGLHAALAAAGLPTGDLSEPGHRFHAYDTLAGERVGYGGFDLDGRDARLRSIVVLPAARRRGIGGGILALLLRRAFDQGARQAWLLTTGATEFFERAGFRQVERSEAPDSVRHASQMKSLCPASAALLRRAITI